MGCAYWSEGIALLLAVVLTHPRFWKLIKLSPNDQAEEVFSHGGDRLLTHPLLHCTIPDTQRHKPFWNN
jgi:hypothetical protein